MKVIRSVKELEEEGLTCFSCGFVPTMGFLHEGHLSLVRRSVSENNTTCVSIFVNPSQFGPGEDFEKYPRDIERDLSLLEETGCDIVFIPETSDMYSDSAVYVDTDRYHDILCGGSRPGHFRGVLTVVGKLFNIFCPSRAYFGEKDYQQLFLIRKMVTDLKMRVEVRGIPVVREKDGLALSSRNIYLDRPHREQAVILYKTLQKAHSLYRKGQDISTLKAQLKEYMRNGTDSGMVKTDYLEILDENSLEYRNKSDSNSRLFIAAFCGDTRLIDNSNISEGL
ncbi:MAG: pantoate--beta-alanine ligase [Candidatus Muiribacteriaceae bacterium]